VLVDLPPGEPIPDYLPSTPTSSMVRPASLSLSAPRLLRHGRMCCNRSRPVHDAQEQIVRAGLRFDQQSFHPFRGGFGLRKMRSSAQLSSTSLPCQVPARACRSSINAFRTPELSRSRGGLNMPGVIGLSMIASPSWYTGHACLPRCQTAFAASGGSLPAPSR